MNYYASLILQSHPNTPPLEVVSEWLNQPITNQPDITLINQEGNSIKIETVRKIKEKLSYAAYNANQTRYFVFLDAHLITIPAQNALLKSVEEPPSDTRLIFVTHTPDKLIETIRSRCEIQIIAHSKEATVTQTAEHESAQKLLTQIINSTHGQRITLAAAYKERSDALSICYQLLRFLNQELHNNSGDLRSTGKQSNSNQLNKSDRTNRSFQLSNSLKLNNQLNTKQITHNLQVILQTIEFLEHNTNALLTIENCFFELQ